MLKTKIINIAILALIFTLFAGNKVYAETTPSQCPTTNPAGTEECLGGEHYAGGQCRLDTVIQAKITECANQSLSYSCSSNECGCLANGPTEDQINDCKEANKNINTCTGTCTTCKTNYELVGKECKPICPSGEERDASGNCVAVYEIKKDSNGFYAIWNAVSGFLTNLVYTVSGCGENQSLKWDGTKWECTFFLYPTKLDGTEYDYVTNDSVLLKADYAAEAGSVPLEGIVGIENLLTPCVTDSDCSGSDICNASGYCQADYTGLTECADNTDCPSNYACIGGYCYDTTGDEGASCNNNGDCRIGYDCINGKCEGEDVPIATGSGLGEFVGVSSKDLNGRLLYYKQPIPAGHSPDYALANDKCEALYPDSHICTAAEIIHSYSVSGNTIGSQSDVAWINNGPPGYLQTMANDCNGWTNNTNDYYGSIWDFNSNSGAIQGCYNYYSFACCK